MKRLGIILLLSGALTAEDFRWIQSFDGLSIQIPDDEISGVVDSRELALPFEIRKVSVHLSLSGASAFNGDLYANLAHGGRLAVLLNRPGRSGSNSAGYGDPGVDIVLDDAAENGDLHIYRRRLFGNDHTPLSAPLTGSWAPDGRGSNPLTVSENDPRDALLDGFAGTPAAGTWNLFVADLELTGSARLTRWSLDFILDPASLIFEIAQPAPATLALLHESATQARVIQFPTRGVLYQTSDGIHPGNEINELNADVSDAQGRVIYQPEAAFAGADSILFEAQGGLNPSPALTAVQIRDRSIKHKVGGTVTLLGDGGPVAGATVFASIDGAIATASTNAQGEFELMVPDGAALRLGVALPAAPESNQGVSTLDIQLIRRFILNPQIYSELESTLLGLIGDVNRDGGASTLDILFIRRHILDPVEFPFFISGQSVWVFLRSDLEISELPQNYNDAFERTYDSVAGGIQDANFLALKLGDVSGALSALLSEP